MRHRHRWAMAVKTRNWSALQFDFAQEMLFCQQTALDMLRRELLK
jgi:hypothetical protein